MNPNAVPFRPLREKLAREKKGNPKVKLADESQTRIYAFIGFDYKETYSPVLEHDLLQTVLAIAAARDLKLVRLDVKTALLQKYNEY